MLRLLAGAILCAISAPAASAQGTVPVRQLTGLVQTDSGAVRLVLGVKHLSDGRVLVNDPVRFRLVILDSTLHEVAVVAGNAPGAAPYGSRAAIIVPFVRDSVALFDAAAATFTVVNANGKLGRTFAPAANLSQRDLITFVTAANSEQGFDPAGRHVYRLSITTPNTSPAVPKAGETQTSLGRNRAIIVRADPLRRSLDTLATLQLAPYKRLLQMMDDGSLRGWEALNPLPQADEWTLLPDGTVAIVRAVDYHIDWIAPDGSVTSSPKLPFDWRRVTDEDKQRIVDSTRKFMEDRRASAPAPPPPPPGVTRAPPPPVTVLDPKELPDYYPPVRTGQVHADADGNVWILPTTSYLAAKGLVWDVVNRKGEVIERVEIPAQRNIVGFGPGGVVYMTDYSTPGNPRLERGRIARP